MAGNGSRRVKPLTDTHSLVRRMLPDLEAEVRDPEALERIRGEVQRCRHWLHYAILILADCLGWLLAITIAVVIRKEAGGEYPYELYLQAWPALLVPLPVFILQGLYAPVPLSAPDELGHLVRGNTLAFAGLASVVFLLQYGEAYSRLVFIMGYALSLVITPAGRSLVRSLLVRSPLWSRPCLIVGDGDQAEQLIEVIRKEGRLALRPVACVGAEPRADGPGGLEVIGGYDQAVPMAATAGVRFAVLANPDLPKDEYISQIENLAGVVPHVLIIPSSFGRSSLWVHSHDLGGLLGLEVRNELLRPWSRYQKRMLDLILSLAVVACFCWLFVLIGIFIKLTSKGPIFYSQRRVGRNGAMIRIWKFRTMVVDADKTLDRYFERNPTLREEWERDRKLKKDPRVTWAGRMLRVSSLDELPQVWNVLKGEMSLVGPRPVEKDEIVRYGAGFRYYNEMTPGVTGLWQVSGRNQTTYDERVAFDAYYARNWSFWLDLILLARTVRVVLLREGAY